jgi:nonribosomal peptide synthetase DhbF
VGAVSTRDTESVLATFPGLADCIVVEHGIAPDERCLVAYVVPGAPDIDVTALHAHARRGLPGPLTPAAIVVVDKLPLAADGTVDPALLPEPNLDGLLPYRAPSTARQETLCALFAEILGVARCGLDSDFFRLHGRSVDAVLLAARISADLGVRVSMTELFRAPTPAELDRRLDADSRPA